MPKQEGNPRSGTTAWRAVIIIAVVAAVAHVQMQRPGAQTSWHANVIDVLFHGCGKLDAIAGYFGARPFAILRGMMHLTDLAVLSRVPFEDTLAVVPGHPYDVPVRVYPAQTRDVGVTTPALIYFHGGGWSSGSPNSHHVLTSYFAEHTGFTVVSVDYRLAPEHKFPVPLDDCVQATSWVFANAAALGIDTTRIAVGGDSAGGNLAAAVTLCTRDDRSLIGGGRIWKQVLLYSAMEPNMFTESMIRNKDAVVLTRAAVVDFVSSYVRPEDISNPLFAPGLSKDLSDLPRAFSLLAEHDPLLDSGRLYAKRLEESGVYSELIVAPLYHAFLHSLELCNDAKKYADDIVRFLVED